MKCLAAIASLVVFAIADASSQGDSFPIAPLEQGSKPWTNTDVPQCEHGTPAGHPVRETQTRPHTAIEEQSIIQKCSDGSVAMLFYITDNTNPNHPKYSANQYWAVPDQCSAMSCAAYNTTVSGHPSVSTNLLSEDTVSGSSVSATETLYDCANGDRVMCRTKTLTTAAGLHFNYYYAGHKSTEHHETHVHVPAKPTPSENTDTFVADHNNTCHWNATSHHFPDHTRVETEYVCNKGAEVTRTVVDNVEKHTNSHVTYLKTTENLPHNGGRVVTTTTRTKQTIKTTNGQIGRGDQCPASGPTPDNLRDDCCRKTVTRDIKYTDYFDDDTPLSWSEKTVYKCHCGGFEIRSSSNGAPHLRTLPCSEPVGECKHTTSTSSGTRHDHNTFETTKVTVACPGQCTDTTTTTHVFNQEKSEMTALSSEVRVKECHITYEGHPAIKTDTVTTTNGHQTAEVTVQGTHEGFKFGYHTTYTRATPDAELVLVSNKDINEMVGGGHGEVLPLPPAVPCKYSDWSDWSSCDLEGACFSNRALSVISGQELNCIPEEVVSEQQKCIKPGCHGMPPLAPTLNLTVPPTAKIQTPGATPQLTPYLVPTQIEMRSPGATPYMTPKMVPTTTKMKTPGATPYMTPKMVPTTTKMKTPGATPYMTPKMVPTTTKMKTPGATPYMTPKMVPTTTKMKTPGATPYMTPEMVPTTTKMKIPGATPYKSPKMVPTTTKMKTPGATPYMTPKMVPTTTQMKTPGATPYMTPKMVPTTTEMKTPGATPYMTPKMVPTTTQMNTPTPMELKTPEPTSYQTPSLVQTTHEKNTPTAAKHLTQHTVSTTTEVDTSTPILRESTTTTETTMTEETHHASETTTEVEVPTLTSHTPSTTVESRTTTATHTAPHRIATPVETRPASCQSGYKGKFCGDIEFDKCGGNYKRDLKCCENSYRCDCWGNCKCKSTSCCSGPIVKVDHSDQEETHSGNPGNYLHCGDVRTDKCHGRYKSGVKCCKNSRKCAGYASIKCSSSHCCAGPVGGSNDNSVDCYNNRGDRRRCA